MGKYVKVHPALIKEKPAMEDFEDGDASYWSHVIKNLNGNSVFFGDFDTDDGGDFDFDLFRLQIGDAYQALTWAEAREFAQAIIALADKYEGRG